MKVDKEKFLFAISYLDQINSVELKDLDLSEFFDKDHVFTREESYETSNEIEEVEIINDTLEGAMEHWRYTGLNNKDFIMTYSTRWNL